MIKNVKVKQLALTSFLIGVNSLAFAEEVASHTEEPAIENATSAPLASTELVQAESSSIVASNVSSQESMRNQNAKDKNQRMAPSLGDKNPPYNNPDRFLFEGSFIFWQADVDGIDYGLAVNSNIETPVVDGAPSVNSTENFTQKDLDFKWNPGFKVGIGMILGNRDEWDVMLNWTWLHSKANRSGTLGTNPGISAFLTPFPVDAITGDISYGIPGFSPNASGTPATFSTTTWKLLYNTIDLELGRNFFLAKNLTLRTHIGLRGALLHQLTKSSYDIASLGAYVNPNETFATGSSTGSSTFKGKNNYDALGLRGGLQTHWNFNDNFCAYGGLSAAILYGQFKTEENYLLNIIYETGEGPLPVNTATNVSLRTHRTRSTIQAALGLMWHTGFNNDKQHLSIGASYEVNQWFQQNELRKMNGNPVNSQALRSPGDLGLHGLTVDLVFDF